MHHWLKFYRDPEMTDQVKEQLLKMSEATIERRLRKYKSRLRRTLALSEEQKNQLKRIYERLDLFKIQSEMQRKINKLNSELAEEKRLLKPTRYLVVGNLFDSRLLGNTI